MGGRRTLRSAPSLSPTPPLTCSSGPGSRRSISLFLESREKFRGSGLTMNDRHEGGFQGRPAPSRRFCYEAVHFI